MMEHVSSRQAVWVWLFLVIASLLTAWAADGGNLFGRWTVIAVLVIAFMKARGVILYYMEVRCAPWQLRLAFEAWAVVVTLVIGGTWLLQGTA
jgi:caa(3)-type oxidase subunit IV